MAPLAIRNGNDRQRSSGHFEKNLLHLQVRVAPSPRCVARQGFATKGRERGKGRECKENTGNVGGETVSRYNQARFLFAFAFKWFRVRYTRNVMQKVRVRIRVKSNRCTTQRVRIHTAQWTFCPAVFSFPIFPLLLPPPFLFSSLRSLLFFFLAPVRRVVFLFETPPWRKIVVVRRKEGRGEE